MSEPQQKLEVEVKEGDILASKYRVEQVLGVGGMGVVVAATHIVLNNRVALKFLLPSVAKHQQTAARFLREAQAAVRIKSPHVARVIDVGQMEDTGSPYMVMEHLEGKDLGQLLETEGTLDVARACLFGLQACEALAAAHAAGIVHRDIKPANLFVTQGPDGSPQIKVLDFGISKNTSDMGVSNLTQTQVSMGSPLYMSPEQMRSARDVDARTDVWSMGVVLFEMLTGQLPFIAETMPQLCALVLEETAPRADRLRPDVPKALADAIARCLEKDREQRFLNVGQLAATLGPYVPVGNLSAERTSRIISGAGLDRTAQAALNDSSVNASGKSLDLGELVPPPRLRGTATAFGRTGERGQNESRRGSLGIVLGALAAFGGVVGMGVLLFTAGSDENPAAAVPDLPAVSDLATVPSGAALSGAAFSGAALNVVTPKPELPAEPLNPAAAVDTAAAQPSVSAVATGPSVGVAPESGAGATVPARPAPSPVKKPAAKPKPPSSDPFGDRF